MLTRIQNLNTASDVGLGLHNCYAINSLKAGMLATAIKIPGFSSLVLNLGLPTLREDRLEQERSYTTISRKFQPKLSPWLKEYLAATKLHCVGFLPS